jgi:tetratricopeptide (TPR) repeat protein
MTEYQNKCFKQALGIFKEEIEVLADTIKTGTEYEKGRYLGNAISYKTIVLMVYQCNNFYNFLDRTRQNIFTSANKDTLKQDLVKYSKLIKSAPTSENYYNRAISYFGLTKFKQAIQDIEKAIKLNNNFPAAYLLRGFISEVNEDYDEAYDDYVMAKKLSDKKQIDLFIVMVDRKRKIK